MPTETGAEGELMAAPTVVTPAEDGRTQGEAVAVGSAATWWYDWVDQHRVAASALVGVIADGD